MAFVRIEDRYAELELILFSKVYATCSDVLAVDMALLVEGTLQMREEEKPRIIANAVCALVSDSDYSPGCMKPSVSRSNDQRRRSYEGTPPQKTKPRKLYLRFESLQSDKIRYAANLVEIFSGDVRVVFFGESEKKYEEYGGCGADCSQKLISELKLLLGSESVVLK